MTRKNDQRNSSQINRTGISVILRICPNKLRSSENKHTCKQSIFYSHRGVGVVIRGYTMSTKPGNRAGKGYARRRGCGCVRGGSAAAVCVESRARAWAVCTHRAFTTQPWPRDTCVTRAVPGPTQIHYRYSLDKTV